MRVSLFIRIWGRPIPFLPAVLIVALLLAAIPVTPALADIAAGQPWASLYEGAGFPGALSYTVDAGSSRMLVVGVASSLAEAAPQTVSVTYGGVSLTQQVGDGDTDAQQHTYLFYLPDTPSVMNGVAHDLDVSIVGGTAYWNLVYAAVYTGVDQSGSPIRDSKNRTSGADCLGGNRLAFSPAGLTIHAGDQAVEMLDLMSCNSTLIRTINTYAPEWSAALTAAGHTGGGTSSGGYALVRTVPASNTTDASGHNLSSSNTWASMSGMSIKPSALAATVSAVESSGTPSTYGEPVTFTATVDDLSATGSVDFYSGGTLLGSGILSTVAGQRQASYTTSPGQLAAGPHSITAAYEGDDSFAGSGSAPVSQQVEKRALAITATGVNKVYDGTTAAAVGLVDDRISGDVFADSYSSAVFSSKHVGTSKTVTVTGISISGPDAGNYTFNASTSTTADITPADASCSINGYVGTYDGASHGASGSCSGVGGESAGTLDLGASFTSVPGGTAHWSLAANGNYNDQSGDVAVSIAQATPALSVANSPVTYSGAAQAAIVVGSVLGAPSNIRYNGSSTIPANAGTYAVTASFTPNDAANYETLVSAPAGSFVIEKANQSISFAALSDRMLGDPPFTVSATAGSGLPVSFSILSGPASISGSTVSLTGTGLVTVRASQAGNSNYNAAPNVDRSFTVSAVGTPIFSASPTAWDFGIARVGAVSASRTFLVDNAGSADLVFGAVALAGADPAQFKITADACSGAAVPPAGTCSLSVAFAPTAAGTRAAYLSFPDNAAGSPHTIPVSGKGATQLALNGGFNLFQSALPMIPSSWTASAFAPVDGKSTTFKKEGSASVRIANTSAVMKTLAQTRSVSGAAGSTLQLSVWIKGQAVPSTPGLARVQVQLFNGATLVQTRSITVPAGTYGFQQKKLTFAASGAYTSVVVKLVYGKATGAVWFDGLSLLRAP